jgi:spermidine/putrescine transport system ATP-binding protein
MADNRAPLVRLTNISKRYGSVTAVHPVSLDIGYGDFFALLGPSGCGKTTLLRMIGGFLAPTTGTIEIAGSHVTHLGPERRKTNMVFQGYGLFPHMTVRQNVAYGLLRAGTAKAEVKTKVGQMLELVHLFEHAERLPKHLSGGQQQRVALARALVMQPKVLLLDEPLAALDLSLRKTMQEELRQIHATIGGTFVFVTHDQGEAMSLATRVAVMNGGAIVQQGSPEHIYRQPATEFVAGFIGEAATFPALRRGGFVRLFDCLNLDSPGADGPVLAVIRPDNLRFAEGGCGPHGVQGTIRDKIFLGSHIRYTIRLSEGSELRMHAPPSAVWGAGAAVGDVVSIELPPALVWIAETGA